MSEEALDHVLEVLAKLTPSNDLAGSQLFYGWGRDKFRGYWRFADMITTLWAAATFLDPQSYLEVGVWRGRSAAVVGAVAPDCSIYGFDMWIPGYHGSENPGADFVKKELANAGHTGEVTLVSGDSRKTLPAFLGEHPDLFFDLITIDGGKSIAVAASDFAAALPRLKVGGIVVYDDMPSLPRLKRIWRKVIERDTRYTHWEFRNAGFGVAAAVRIAE